MQNGTCEGKQQPKEPKKEQEDTYANVLVHEPAQTYTCMRIFIPNIKWD